VGALKKALPWVVALAALALALSRAAQDGLWYDEAYTARLARLPLGRALTGAMQDVHPPTWTVIAWLFARLPLSIELALRLPAALSYAGLAGLLTRRAPLAGLAILFHLPLLDLAAQGRAYSTLALALVAMVHLVPQGRPLLTGLLAGFAASLHGTGPLLVAVLLFPSLPWHSIRPRELGMMAAAALLPQLWWMPAFIEQAMRYAGEPWYVNSTAWDWLVISDGQVGLAALAVAVMVGLPGAARPLLPALALALTLALAEVLGAGMEIRKLGALFPGLILLGLAQGNRPLWATGALALGLMFSNRTVDDRPDLREAAMRVRALPAMPVLAWYAGEMRAYHPATLWSGPTPMDTARRLTELFAAQEIQCAAIVNLWDTAPEEALPPGLEVRAWAEVTGLDVRLIGTEACSVDSLPAGWHVGSACKDPQLREWVCEGREAQ